MDYRSELDKSAPQRLRAHDQAEDSRGKDEQDAAAIDDDAATHDASEDDPEIQEAYARARKEAEKAVRKEREEAAEAAANEARKRAKDAGNKRDR